MQDYLKITYEVQSHEVPCDESSHFNKYRTTPFRASEIFPCSIYSYDCLTDEDTRKVYDLKFSLDNMSYNFEPGFTIAVLPSNDEKEVDELMIRLGIESVAEKCFKLEVLNNSAKKKSCIPKHIPVYGTIRNVFLHHLDIRSIPKKLFLKSLLGYVKDKQEHEKLQHLCSPKGSEEYNKLISSHAKRSLLGLLNQFSSCCPPVEKLFEHLPPLLPRPYSISSSPLNNNYVSITFNVDIFNNNKKGVCTSWLETCIDKFRETKNSKVPIYFRISSSFILPTDNFTPIIMIATGTGIVPFRGFLEHRYLQIESQNTSFGESWLFYGCRDSNRNYLFKDDLKVYLKSGALSKLFESFSRENEQKIYVQDRIERCGKNLSALIIEKCAVIYVCGDFQKVLPAVRNSILNIFMKFCNYSSEAAEEYLKSLERENRYIVENWT